VTDPFVLAVAFITGALFGSFLNVCISRWPADQSVVRPRSRCPKCGHQITWYENIPMLSWLALRGRCSGCREPISFLYPMIELAVGLLWMGSVFAFGPTFTALRVAVLGTVLIGIMATDALHYTIPDGFTAFGAAWAVIAAVVAAVAIQETSPFAGLYDAVIGACVGAGAIAIAGWIGEMVFKKEAMGFGDITLMAMVGAHLGPGRTLLTVFVGALLGAVIFVGIVYPIAWVRSRRRGVAEFEPPLVPFGVFLAPAGMIALFWGSAVIDWYIHDFMGL
jgi:leader peptidase (prepilin peptidase) / N-methyltransferase